MEWLVMASYGESLKVKNRAKKNKSGSRGRRADRYGKEDE